MLSDDCPFVGIPNRGVWAVLMPMIVFLKEKKFKGTYQQINGNVSTNALFF